jgi:hypothetical protein
MEGAQTRGEPSLAAKQTVALGLVAVFLITFLSSLLIYGFNIAMPMIAADLKGMALYSWAISLPAELSRLMDEATLTSIADPRVLMSPEAMTGLRNTLNRAGEEAPAFFDQTVRAVRGALESSLKRLFLIGAVPMLLSFLLILTIPEVSMDIEVQDKKQVRQPASP